MEEPSAGQEAGQQILDPSAPRFGLITGQLDLITLRQALIRIVCRPLAGWLLWLLWLLCLLWLELILELPGLSVAGPELPDSPSLPHCPERSGN